ncbi:MAG: hypothetical protein D3924_12245 [Candidatus Electrothrix sp. AR4]|nr:hypothetical protein [Candidatus Electrothrix sp. AR4]
MRKQEGRTHAVWGKCLFLIFILNTAGCADRVVMPTNDQTAPDMHWDILDPDTKEHGLIQKDNQQTVLEENKVYLTLCKAEDPEGVKKVSMKITADLFCQRNVENPSSADYYKHKNKMYEVLENKKYEADESNMVPISGFVSVNLNGNRWKGIDCKNGYTSSTVRDYTIKCTAWNWSNQTTTRSLHVIHGDIFQ